MCRKTDVRARARRLLGAIQFAKAEAGAGAYEDAAKTFSELAADVDDDVERADAMYSQAVCLYRCKKYQESNGLITQILDMTVAETRIPDVMMLQGRVLVLLHQQDAALESFTEVIRRWPGHGRIADCEFQRAECLFGMQRFTEASEGFRKASEERGFSHADLALLKYGQAQEKRGEMWDAFEIYASMPRRFPKSRHRDDALAACAKLIARHAAVRSQARRSVVNGNVDGEIAGAFLAAHYYTKSDYAEALRIADLAIALDRANDARQANRLHFLHADILRKMPGRAADAVAEYKDLGAETAGDRALQSRALYHAAVTAAEAGMHDDAAAICDEWLRRFPGHRLQRRLESVKARLRK